MAKERQIPIPLFDAYTARCAFCRGIIMLISDPWIKCDCCSGIRHLECSELHKISSRGEIQKDCNTVCGNHDLKEELVEEDSDSDEQQLILEGVNVEDGVAVEVVEVPKYVCPACLIPCDLRGCNHEYCKDHFIQCACCNSTVCAKGNDGVDKNGDTEKGVGVPDDECSFMCEGGDVHEPHVVCKECWHKGSETCTECARKCECCDSIYHHENSGGYCEGCQHSHCDDCSAYCEACESSMCSCCGDNNRVCDGCDKTICGECRKKCSECNERKCPDCLQDCEHCGNSVCKSSDKEGDKLCYVKCSSPRCTTILCNSCQDDYECKSCDKYYCQNHMDEKCDLCDDNTCPDCLTEDSIGEKICNVCMSKEDTKRKLVMDRYPIEGEADDLILKIENIDREIENATAENKHHLHNTRFLLANKLEQELQKIQNTIDRNRNDAVVASIKGKPPLDLEDIEDVEPYDVIYGKTLEALLLQTSGNNRTIGVDLSQGDAEPYSEYANLALPAASRAGSIDLMETPDPIGYLEEGARATFECRSPFTGMLFTLVVTIDRVGTKDKNDPYFRHQREMKGIIVPVSEFNSPVAQNDFYIDATLVTAVDGHPTWRSGRIERFFGMSIDMDAERAGITTPYRYTAEVSDNIARWDDGITARITCVSVVPPTNEYEKRGKELDLADPDPNWEAYNADKNTPHIFMPPDLEPGVATPDDIQGDYRWIGRDIDLDDETRTNPIGQIPARYRSMGFTRVGEKKKSNRSGKKWMVLAKKGNQYKVVHGGYEGMQDYTQHRDSDRRKKFWSRMGGKNSSKANDPFSPLYWHKKFGTW